MNTYVHLMKERRTNQAYIGLWMPLPLVRRLKQTAQQRDSDMSKFIRSAIREKLERRPIARKEAA
ncbi:ribbon-helix-helix protein, CopG family [Termitidicoccus mucosus]|uniref:Uncharacterized protein n=1 Tax=Termitidicoccus mucosus TaxID=1184151 RepID=A0A178II60_9BACT|nr:hypothetical protein AW736_13805 [Opitutaceae bacterium TSB47]